MCVANLIESKKDLHDIDGRHNKCIKCLWFVVGYLRRKTKEKTTFLQHDILISIENGAWRCINEKCK